jgi:hypothetical protein
MKKYLTIVTSVVVSLAPVSVFAATTFKEGIAEAGQTAAKNGLFLASTLNIIENIILFLMAGNALLAVGAIVWASFLYVTSFTDEEKTKKAKLTVIQAVVGLLLIVLAFIIVQTIRKVILKNP